MQTLELPNGDVILYDEEGNGVWLTRTRRRRDLAALALKIDAEVRALEERRWIPALSRYFVDLGDQIARRLSSRSRRMAKHLRETRKTPPPDVLRAQATQRAAAMLDDFWDQEAFEQEFADFVESMYDDTSQTALASTSLTMGIDFNLAARKAVSTYVTTRANQLAGHVSRSTYKQIQRVIRDGILEGASIPDIADAIRLAFTAASRTRATRIARTEAISAYNGAVYTGGTNLPPSIAAGMVWMSTADARTRPQHLAADGQMVDMGQPFVIGGEQLRFPGDPNGRPRNTINCRCSTAILTPDDMEARSLPMHRVGDVLVRMAVQGLSYTDALWELRGDLPNHPFRGNQWNGQSGSSVPVSKMTRKQLLAHMQANGYVGPTSYNMARLRQISDTHTSWMASHSPTAIAASGSHAPSASSSAPLTSSSTHTTSSSAPAASTGTPAPPSKPIGSMTRAQLTAHLKAEGYSGPTSYTMDRLRNIATSHMSARASLVDVPKGKYVPGRDRHDDESFITSAKQTTLRDPTYHHGDRTLAQLTQAQGFDGLPTVVTAKQHALMSAAGEFHVFSHRVSSMNYQTTAKTTDTLHRGVRSNGYKTADQMMHDLRHGTFFAGLGVYGNGTYSSPDKSVANSYGGGHSGNVTSFSLRKGSRIVKYSTLQNEYSAQQGYRHFADLSHFAVAKGYDAMIVDGGVGHVVVYNRTAMVIQEG